VLEVRAAPDAVEIHVIDEGVGMSDADRHDAFAPFWQGGPRSTSNTGLGLAIVDQLVRANGGTVALTPSPSGGIDAVVRFSRLPR
jgi:signal transduction histidine kinase